MHEPETKQNFSPTRSVGPFFFLRGFLGRNANSAGLFGTKFAKNLWSNARKMTFLGAPFPQKIPWRAGPKPHGWWMGAPNPDGWPTPHPRNPFQLSPIFRSPFSFGAEDSTLANAIMGGHQHPFPSTFPEQPCLRVRRTQVPRVIEEMWFLPKSLPAGTHSNFSKTTQNFDFGRGAETVGCF